MTISDSKRDTIRERYNFACGYCGISEIDAGSELEIDHFCPIIHGGDDEWDNLVYACPACNRNKASYWPSPDTPPHMLLLHPLTDDLNIHLTLLQDGYLAGLTPRGWFHIEWLHLNRPQLVTMRQRRAIHQRTQKVIEKMQQINHQLVERIALQKQELHSLRQKVRRLGG
jgi:hypothetical protein